MVSLQPDSLTSSTVFPVYSTGRAKATSTECPNTWLTETVEREAGWQAAAFSASAGISGISIVMTFAVAMGVARRSTKHVAGIVSV